MTQFSRVLMPAVFLISIASLGVAQAQVTGANPEAIKTELAGSKIVSNALFSKVKAAMIELKAEERHYLSQIVDYYFSSFSELQRLELTALQLSSDSQIIRGWGVNGLRSLLQSSEAKALVKQALADSDVRIRRAAAISLARSASFSMIDLIELGLSDTDLEVRHAALSGLATKISSEALALAQAHARVETNASLQKLTGHVIDHIRFRLQATK